MPGNHIPSNSADNSKDSILLEIMKQTFAEGKAYATIFVTTFTVYLAINGALLKYSFEKGVVPMVPTTLSIIGIATSVLYFAIAVFKWCIRKNLARDIKYLNQRLGNPLFSKQFLILNYMSVSTGIFSLFGLVGWIMLYARFR